jgi:hypothetical protein
MGWGGRFRLFFQGLGATLCRVKKVSKAILIALGALLALAVILVVGLNLYVQSPGAQARIQEELSKALRLPLKITNTSVTPWSDLRITGITIPSGDANFLEAASFSARYRLLPLFENKLIITEMRVDEPKIVWRQDAENKWKLPEPEQAAAVAVAESKAAPEGPATPFPLPEAPPADTPKAEKVAKKDKPVKKKSFAVVVERFEVKNGAVELLDHEGKHVAVFTDVNMTYTKLTAEQLEGTATIGKAVWADGLALENVRTPFSFTQADHELSLPDITAILAGGSLKGKFLRRSDPDRTPFNATVILERVNLDRLVTQTGGEAGQATGDLSGQIEVRGETENVEKRTGTGHLELRDGQLRQLEFFQSIGQALGLRELSNLRVKEGQADLHLSGEKIIVERLVLTTIDLELSSKGTVRLNDKKVALDAQLSVEDALLKQLPSLVRDSFATAENNRRTIDFNVTGTTDKLRTNLLDKLIGQKVNMQFGDLLSNLFGGDKKAEEEKKKKEEEERKKAEKKAEKDRKKKDKDKDKDKPAPAPEAASTPADATPPPAVPPNP